MVLWKKLWHYGQNYCTIPRTFYEEKTHGIIPKSKKL